MIDTEAFYNALLARGLDFFAGVPDSLLKELCACILDKTPPEKNTIAANEGNAVAMCAGYHLATQKVGVTYMQNSGEGNAVNPLLSLADEDVYSIPVLLIIGWRGEPQTKDEPQHVKQGKVTLSLLETMGIAYDVLDDDYTAKLDKAARYLKEQSRPYALIVKKGAFSPYAAAKAPAAPRGSLTREDALRVVLAELGDNDAIVSTTGKTSRELFELREANGQGHAHDFLTVGSMGHTASIAYGIAAGTNKTVWCIDGDGSFIMHMGGMAVIGSKMPSNFRYILNDNGAHESVGGQPTCSPSIDIPAVLKACGFTRVIVADSADAIQKGMRTLKDTPRAAMILRTKAGARKDLGRPTTTPQENKKAFMEMLQK